MNPLKLAIAYSFFEDADWAIASIPKILQQEIEYPHAKSEALVSTTSTANKVKPATATTTDVKALSELQGNLITYPQLQTFVLATTDAYTLRIRTVAILLISEASTVGLGNVYGILIGDSEGIAEVIADGFVLREDLFEKTTAIANTILFGSYIARAKDIQINTQANTYGDGKLIKYGSVAITAEVDDELLATVIIRSSATTLAQSITDGAGFRRRFLVADSVLGQADTMAMQFKLPSVVELSVREDGFLTTKDTTDRKYYLANGKLKVGQSNVGKIKFKVNRFVLQHNN